MDDLGLIEPFNMSVQVLTIFSCCLSKNCCSFKAKRIDLDCRANVSKTFAYNAVRTEVNKNFKTTKQCENFVFSDTQSF